MNKTVISIFFVFLLTACTQAAEVPIATKIPATNTKEPTATKATLNKTLKPTITNTPKLTNTDLPPTSTHQTIDFEVTFDGNGCTVSGPTEVPIGDYSFLLNNASDRRVKLVVGQLLDGHTFQDMVDLQNEPGDIFAIEPWMSKPFYYTKDHKIYIVSLDEAGEHVISISVYNHVAIWLCVPFQVIESPP
jgi:hypothetical protein